jgi:hypothetical protein
MPDNWPTPINEKRATIERVLEAMIYEVGG